MKFRNIINLAIIFVLTVLELRLFDKYIHKLTWIISMLSLITSFVALLLLELKRESKLNKRFLFYISIMASAFMCSVLFGIIF
jgi:hypothetical protein